MNETKMVVGRIARRAPATAWRNFYSAFVNRDQFITFLLSVVTTVIVAPRLDARALADLGDSWAASMQAILWVTAFWALWCAFLSPLWVIIEDSRKFTRHGNRFVYHEPRLVATLRCRPTGEMERYRVTFDDAEPGAFVNCQIELDCVPPGAMLDFGSDIIMGERGSPAQKVSRIGVLLAKNRRAALGLMLPPASVAVTARIYCLDFIVGPHNDQDGNVGDFRLRPFARRNGEGRGP